MKVKKIMATVLAIAATISTFGFASCNKDDTLVVYTEAGFAPFEYIQNGKIVGVDVDIMNKVGEKLGKKVVFENVGFDTIVDSVAEGKLCNVGAAGISAFPMSSRVIAKMALKEDPSNFILMQSTSANVSGQLGSIVAGGMVITLVTMLIGG